MDEKDGDDARHRLEEQERRNKRKVRSVSFRWRPNNVLLGNLFCSFL